MPTCAYCEKICRSTREHVIPRWYCETPGENVLFNARRPLTHTQGEMTIKDVCENCNNGVLSCLDGLGKDLYDRFFSTPVFYAETVHFVADWELLIRWLLKLSYNSARVHNADTTVLSQYRDVILGNHAIPASVRCFLHLIPPSFQDASEGFRPARRQECSEGQLLLPQWFRITKLRLPYFPTTVVVQRAVMINAFAFSLLIPPPNDPSCCAQVSDLRNLLMTEFPAAVELNREGKHVAVTACTDHVAMSLAPLICNYPLRFGEDSNPELEKIITGEVQAVMMVVPQDIIESGDISPIANPFHDMVSTREKATGFRQRISLAVLGYDDDPRELWEIPEVNLFLQRLFVECPFVFFLSHEEGSLLRLLFACWMFDVAAAGPTDQRNRHEKFMTRAFGGLNEVMYRLGMSVEANREICEAATRTLFGKR